MGGGLLQLVAHGAQDAVITGNPHITFWKTLFKRHTNFAMEAFRVNFTGAPAWGQRLVAIVNRNADLVTKAYLEVTLPDTTATALGGTAVNWTGGAMRRLGYLMLQRIDLEIGGQIIDTHYGEWLHLWESLTGDIDTCMKLDQMVNPTDSTTGRPANAGTTTSLQSCGGRPQTLYIPLQFWFCRHAGLALPLIALQYHEVRFNITLADATDLVTANVGSTVAATAARLPPPREMALYLDYIFLDVEERRRFAQDSHEYLIEQLQYTGEQQITTSSARLDLTLNHPIKELVWVFQDVAKKDCGSSITSAAGFTQPFSYDDIVNRCRLQINGQDRFDERYGDYFWKVQRYQHHTGGAFGPLSRSVLVNNATGNTSPTLSVTTSGGQIQENRVEGVPDLLFGNLNPINVYSFALKPEEQQPSGSCNFSRIDNATLVFDSIQVRDTNGRAKFPTKTTPYSFRLYAVNYNIFRVMSGMGGLAYSN